MIAENLQRIRERINHCALTSRRNPEDIQLIAVSKKIPVPLMKEALHCGQFFFGENYIQEAEQKKNELKDTVGLHLIGHLQSNKAKIAARVFHTIHTVDSFKLASALSKHLVALQRTMKILIQVNIGDDPNKSGIMPENAEKLLQQLKTLKNLEPLGLMTIPPLADNPEETRPHFGALRLLAERLAEKELFQDNRKFELSMGMSDDFEVAIEEGATMVRIGTAIFGQRPSSIASFEKTEGK
jgi:pyridoxal phosphate enzyme (YggS family)